jgi:hypothetical protein
MTTSPKEPTREVLHYTSHGQTTYLAEHHFALNLDDRPFDEYPTRHRLRHGAPVSIYTHPTTGAAREVWADHPDPKTLPPLPKHYGGHFSDAPPPLHRDDGPAVIERDRAGDLTEHWYRHGKPYHPSAHERMKWEACKIAQGTPFHAETLESLAGGEPSMGATRELRSAAVGTKITAHSNYPLHCETGPAITERDPATGRITRTVWLQNNERHRTDGPAEEVFDPTTGVCVRQEHHQKGFLSNSTGPAIVERTPQGEVIGEHWKRRGKTFRDHGPASIKRHAEDPNWFLYFHWHLNGRTTDEPTPKAWAAWQQMVKDQGGVFTPGLDQTPVRPERASGVKAAAEAARAEPRTAASTPQQGEQR